MDAKQLGGRLELFDPASLKPDSHRAALVPQAQVRDMRLASAGGTSSISPP